MVSWGDVFTPRQQLANLTYARLAREFVAARAPTDAGYSEALVTLLGLFVNKLADLNASLCGWQLSTAKSRRMYLRGGCSRCSWISARSIRWHRRVDHLNPLAHEWQPDLRCVSDAHLATGAVEKASATRLPLPDEVAQAVITDPPYYDAVPYSYLSDFFYVWLRRTVGTAHPDLMRTELTEKDEECIVDEISGKSKANTSSVLCRLRWKRRDG